MSINDLLVDLDVVGRRILGRAEGFSLEQWNSVCDEDGRKVGQVIGHISDVIGVTHQIVKGIIEEVSYQTLSLEWITTRNAERAELVGKRSMEDVLAELKGRLLDIGRLVEGLTDDQLLIAGVVFVGNDPWPVHQVLSFLLISHVSGHFDEIERSLANQPSDAQNFSRVDAPRAGS